MTEWPGAWFSATSQFPEEQGVIENVDGHLYMIGKPHTDEWLWMSDAPENIC